MRKLFSLFNIFSICYAWILLTAATNFAQPLAYPRPSPNATLSQTIGITDVAVTYSRPGVKGREIWGKLVPYNQVWRTGANENTTISFGDSVKIEGQKLAAGIYSLATIPTEKEWTIIFNKNTKMWGAFVYNQEQDALRVKVTPQPGEITERMNFSFTDLTDNSATLVLNWEKLKIPIKIEVNTPDLVLAKARPTVSPQPFMQLANYCLENNTHLDEAMKWIDQSLAIAENYSNLRVKARLLEKTGKTKDAIAMMEKAIQLGKAMKQPPFDFDQMQQLLGDWKKK